MLALSKAIVYEFSIAFTGVFLIAIIQMTTGNFLTWILWMYSIITVTLGFIDHACLGWRNFGFDVQMRRLVTNFIFCVPTGFAYYHLMFLLIPNMDLTTIMSTLGSIQKFLRMYNYFGGFIYAFMFTLFHFCILSGVRFFTNLVYCIFLIFDSLFQITGTR